MRNTTSWGVVTSLLGGLLAVVGCGGETGEGFDTGGPNDTLSGAPSLHDDLITPAVTPAVESEETTIRSALSGQGNDPKVFYLEYADGTAHPAVPYDACQGTPPKFECAFAPTLAECQRQIQAYLDVWYADFNIVFTLTRPTSGKYYTEIVSSGGGAWCKADSKVAGVAPFLCKDLKAGVAYTFQGGRSAKETAVIIAQEQAHLLGLEHTSSSRDLMYPTICQNCDGFVNEEVPVTGSLCDRPTQNSYKMVKAALGPWGGGPKPSPFGCMDDKQAPSVTFLSPASSANATVGHDFSVRVDVKDDCDVAKVEIAVMPEGLTATAKAPPYQWDLTGINGAQTVTVTATDGKGRTGSATLTVTAPGARQQLQEPGMDGAGCDVASGAYGAAGLVPSLAMLLLFAGHNRRSRRRKVTGELLTGIARNGPRARSR